MPRRRRLGASLLFFLFEFLECPIGVSPHLIRSRLRKRFRLIASASRDQRKDKDTYDHSGSTLSHLAMSMIHSRPLLSILLITCGSQ